jgi:16S rRNA (guanine527-N7)-methyltransferase
MATLSESRIAQILEPYLVGESVAGIYGQLSLYLDLLLKWNARTNLTAIREPEEIVRRHFGESVFAGRHLVPCATLLDFGSGAGFPGLPIQLLRPEIAVTLAESQNKKATFLREVVRSLGLATEVWDKRVEDMPVSRKFDAVCMRAVDAMEVAVPAATARVRDGGQLAILTTAAIAPTEGALVRVSGSESGVLYLRTFHVEHSANNA